MSAVVLLPVSIPNFASGRASGYEQEADAIPVNLLHWYIEVWCTTAQRSPQITLALACLRAHLNTKRRDSAKDVRVKGTVKLRRVTFGAPAG